MSTNTSTVALEEQYVVDGKGRRTAVLLPLNRYRRLIEDLHDLAVVAERRGERPISLEQIERKLKDDGLLLHLRQTLWRKTCLSSPEQPLREC